MKNEKELFPWASCAVPQPDGSWLVAYDWKGYDEAALALNLLQELYRRLELWANWRPGRRVKGDTLMTYELTFSDEDTLESLVEDLEFALNPEALAFWYALATGGSLRGFDLLVSRMQDLAEGTLKTVETLPASWWGQLEAAKRESLDQTLVLGRTIGRATSEELATFQKELWQSKPIRVFKFGPHLGAKNKVVTKTRPS